MRGIDVSMCTLQYVAHTQQGVHAAQPALIEKLLQAKGQAAQRQGAPSAEREYSMSTQIETSHRHANMRRAVHNAGKVCRCVRRSRGG